MVQFLWKNRILLLKNNNPVRYKNLTCLRYGEPYHK